MVLMTPPQQVAPFPPPDAKEENKYKIKRNESFASVAMDNGITDVWQLIDFNLQTNKSPRVVNWYLWHRYKCRRTTASGKNLLFDGGEIIYLPNKEEESGPEPPLPEGVADPEQLAKLLDLDPKSLKKFINEYGWGVNVAEGVTALIVEFAAVGAAGAAAGAVATVGFAVLGPVLVLISYPASWRTSRRGTGSLPPATSTPTGSCHPGRT